MTNKLTFIDSNNAQVTLDKNDIINYVFILTEPDDKYHSPHFILKTKQCVYVINYASQFKDLKDYFKENNIPGNL